MEKEDQVDVAVRSALPPAQPAEGEEGGSGRRVGGPVQPGQPGVKRRRTVLPGGGADCAGLERLEQAPTCFPDGQPCACRLMRIGKIEYDSHLGYPRQITYRREAQPNWTHLDFWRHLWEQRDLPTCGTSRTTRIAVISFAPLP